MSDMELAGLFLFRWEANDSPGTPCRSGRRRPASATLLADVWALRSFQTGFNRWVDNPGGQDLAPCLCEAGAELVDAVATYSGT
jgi:hypothetical protein